MRRVLFSAVLLLASANAYATKLCVVDFQTAVTETEEGKSAQKNIDSMYSTRKGELERMQSDLEKAITDFQSRAMILSKEARASEEQKLALQQRTFEQTYQQYQNEMQQTYYTLLGELDEKMRVVAVNVGKESGCAIVLDSAVVVYQGSDVSDISTTLVAKFNAQHPAK